MRIAIVHDWLTGQRGGENVLEEVLALLPGADLHAISHVPGSVRPAIEARSPRTTWVSYLPGARRSPGVLLPILPRLADRWPLERYDAVLSLSHCVAHAARSAGAVHVSYCLTPMRYVWDAYDLYEDQARALGPFAPLARVAGRALRDRLRAWDRRAASSLDAVACISRRVRERIARAWGIDAPVIPPPVDVDAFARAARDTAPGERWLAVSAIRPNKRLDLVAAAFRALGRPLDIAGDGSPRARARLERIGGPNVRALGRVSDAELRRLVASARGLVHAADEDFGIAPVEALAAGRPVVASSASAVREAVIDGDELAGGVLFDELSPGALADAIRRAEATSFDPELLRARARRFSRERFRAAFSDFLAGHPAFSSALATEPARC